jgi:organic hydroperoxide reductase OsmC/OhrA
MHQHRASVAWQRTTDSFAYEDFKRDHRVIFENGQSALSSSAPAFFGNQEALNPETLLLGALVTCHMLTFLAVASKRGFIVNDYHDEAVGVLDKNDKGKMAITLITLKPRVRFEGNAPTEDELKTLHDKAHANCFIANSIQSEVEISPQS